MRLLIEQAATDHRHHLVDAVGELIAAVFDVHSRRVMRQVLAVDISHPRHSTSPPALFCPLDRWDRGAVAGPIMARQAPIFSGRSLPKTPSDFSLRWSAERSMPTNAAVREMLPPKRVTWAIRYSRSKTSRASRSGKVIISPPLSHLTTVGAMAVMSLGSISARTGSRASPGVMINNQSTTLRSCRTLPGQV